MSAPLHFVIRDDDLAFFSTPDHIRSAYQETFDQGVPVSFAIIPLLTLPNDAWMPPHTETTGEFSVGNNTTLVDYIKNNPLIEVMQHGYTHQNFEYAQKKDLNQQTLQGKKILEEAFQGPVTVFVAPHDQFSHQGIMAIENAKLNIIRGKGSKSIKSFFKMLIHRLKFLTLTRHDMPAYPYVVNFGGHKEAFGIRIESGRENLLRALHFAHQTGGNFILVNHIHDFSDEKKKLMLELIYEAKKLGARFVKASEVF